MARRFQRIAFIASPTADARGAADTLMRRYDSVAPEEADVIVALGGDGLMLQALHRFMLAGIPIYGMNRGTVGFLMNEYREDNLLERLESTKRSTIHPLMMEAVDVEGRRHTARAINEVYMLRQTHQTAKLKISVDGHVRLPELIADGVLCATPAGSTAYNLSVGGPILPLNSRLLALTPISAFRPRRWHGALLPDHARIHVEVLDAGASPGGGGGRPYRIPPGLHRGDLARPQDRPHPPPRSRPQPGRADSSRTVRLIRRRHIQERPQELGDGTRPFLPRSVRLA